MNIIILHFTCMAFLNSANAATRETGGSSSVPHLDNPGGSRIYTVMRQSEGSSPGHDFNISGGSRVYIQTKGRGKEIFAGVLIPVGPDKIPTWIYQQFQQTNSMEHVYVSIPRETEANHFIANLKTVQVNIYNILNSRCIIKHSNSVSTTTLKPYNWQLATSGIPAIFVRLPDENHTSLGGVLRSWNEEDGILPKWVR
ncbi:uncharacterized protein LOC117168065 isoform X2 [Belonocnema kinseyi]|uniref:uncharacterized protein LOC117168065 isoform X2 n=1 Tax=Belonocnema kinseyi TaxID=2817044 RepID=UPI00143D7092|nr:uncharacterized protein LOC117168065 isoform X2 [Belonocnema kinseyi]